MITTLPGLYVTSYLMLALPAQLLSFKAGIFCTTYALRCTNLFFSTGNVAVLFLLLKQMHPKMNSNYTFLVAVTLGSFPVLYFFTFLYYTDVASTFFTLLMYLLHLKQCNILAALTGVVAVIFRQTNIVWVAFMVGMSIQHTILQWMAVQKKNVKSQRKQDLVLLQTFFNLVYTNTKRNRKAVLELLITILSKSWSYFVVCFLFLVFVYVNNGIVVGDRTHHQVALNFPQIFYFLMVALFFSSPHLISTTKITNWFKFSVHQRMWFAGFAAIAALAIDRCTYVHEYLLADNRHYTFYVWSKIFRRHFLVRFLLIPFYWYAIFQVCVDMKKKNIFWKIIFTICVLVSLVPQKLLEFRYFIIPYLILRVNMPLPTPTWKMCLEFLLGMFINALTIYMFAFRTFTWPGSNEIQHFMW